MNPPPPKSSLFVMMVFQATAYPACRFLLPLLTLENTGGGGGHAGGLGPNFFNQIGLWFLSPLLFGMVFFVCAGIPAYIASRGNGSSFRRNLQIGFALNALITLSAFSFYALKREYLLQDRTRRIQLLHQRRKDAGLDPVHTEPIPRQD